MTSVVHALVLCVAVSSNYERRLSLLLGNQVLPKNAMTRRRLLIKTFVTAHVLRPTADSLQTLVRWWSTSVEFIAGRAVRT